METPWQNHIITLVGKCEQSKFIKIVEAQRTTLSPTIFWNGDTWKMLNKIIGVLPYSTTQC